MLQASPLWTHAIRYSLVTDMFAFKRFLQSVRSNFALKFKLTYFFQGKNLLKTCSASADIASIDKISKVILANMWNCIAFAIHHCKGSNDFQLPFSFFNIIAGNRRYSSISNILNIFDTKTPIINIHYSFSLFFIFIVEIWGLRFFRTWNIVVSPEFKQDFDFWNGDDAYESLIDGVI